MERLITILAMLLGVVSFTFVVSNINSIISQNKKKVKMNSKNLIHLEKIQKKYHISEELVSMAKKEINGTTYAQNQESFMEMIAKFPKGLQNDLHVNMYRKKLESINMFKNLPPEVTIMLGHALTSIIFMPSTRS